jgi:acyl-CoA thioester hydrolase
VNDATAPTRKIYGSADFPFRVTETIRFRDLDRNGHVNNAVFATYFETGRVFFLREVYGAEQFARGGFVVARLEVNYLREVHWPGQVEICVGVERIGKSSVTYAQGLFVGDTCVANGRTVIVRTDPVTRRSAPLPEEVVRHLGRHMMRG